MTEIPFEYKSFGTSEITIDTTVPVSFSPATALVPGATIDEHYAYVVPSEQLTDEWITTFAAINYGAAEVYIITDEEADFATLLELLKKAKS